MSSPIQHQPLQHSLNQFHQACQPNNFQQNPIQRQYKKKKENQPNLLNTNELKQHEDKPNSFEKPYFQPKDYTENQFNRIEMNKVKENQLKPKEEPFNPFIPPKAEQKTPAKILNNKYN